jgi:hypothetical protein
MQQPNPSAMTYRLRLTLVATVLLTLLVLAPATFAQELEPRFGMGVNGVISTLDGLGFGFRGRASAPINADFSLAVDIGFTGFILGGRDRAT